MIGFKVFFVTLLALILPTHEEWQDILDKNTRTNVTHRSFSFVSMPENGKDSSSASSTNATVDC